MNNRDITIKEFIRINDRVLCADEDNWYGYSWCGGLFPAVIRRNVTNNY